MSFIANVLLAVLVAQAPSASPASSAGDAAFARGDFQTAFTQYNDAIAKNPFDGEAVLGLGTLDLYRNDWPNARTYLNRARHLIPNDPRVMTRLAVLEQRLPHAGHYRFELQNGRSDIPLVAIDPVPVIKAMIGTTTVSLAIDTSVASIDLTPAAAARLGLSDGMLAPAITFPGLVVNNVPVAVTDRANRDGLAVDGAIGTVFLSHFLPTLDYAHNRLTLRLWEASPALDASLKQLGASIEPMWLVGDRLLVASGRLDNAQPGMFAIRTATASAVTVPSDDAGSLPVVSLGRFTQGPLVAVPMTTQSFENVPFEVRGIFGNAFFRNATLTLDFASMKIIVSR